ncbi:MAG: penicillin-binding protein 2 [candidate division WOR-3 bacterium]|uniref:Penicillin-binding protein 2 n=1 Tax=candidate division WOR-3 bacterium TaxID=2052148 RepID=A0A7C1NBP3_UNCW3|nr:penicillin-binding protein 2 [candidate division WOR-3 bacterium]
MKDRLKRLCFILITLLLILGARLIQLQIIQGKRYARLSDRNRIRKIVLPAPRGRIFDRNGILLADTRPTWTVAIIPTETNDSALALLSILLNRPQNELLRRLQPVSEVPAPIDILRNASFDVIAKIEENNFRLPGVLVRVDHIRNYPFRNLYSHVIGYVGEITEEELSRDSSYRLLDYIGKTGIEARYERFLRGRDGYKYVEVDARGREIGPLPEKRPEPYIPGKDIYLTIDHNLQQAAYDLISKYERAAVVAIAINTGEILCLVSYPDFDPNIFLAPLNPSQWNTLISNKSKPFYNRAISSAYPPGSTFKPLVALLALEKQLITPHAQLLPCNGTFQYGNRKFKCWSAHGRLNIIGAIEQSCNVFFYQLGTKIRVDTLAEFCHQFGLGKNTGIDIPGENAGNIPDRDFLNRRYGKNQWTQGFMLNYCIGQGEVLVTALQLTQLYSCFANGGFYFRPYLVAKIESAGQIILINKPQRFEVKINQTNLDWIKNALTRVVEYGTGQAAQLQEITIAGKTGTAQNPPNPDHAWFVGYAPADNPEIAIAVIIENAGHGGTVAAPIVGELVRYYFTKRTLP